MLVVLELTETHLPLLGLKVCTPITQLILLFLSPMQAISSVSIYRLGLTQRGRRRLQDLP